MDGLCGLYLMIGKSVVEPHDMSSLKYDIILYCSMLLIVRQAYFFTSGELVQSFLPHVQSNIS